MYYLGVDLGGTNIASAVVTEKGELLGRSSIPTGLPDSPEHIAERIAESCRQAVSATGCSLEDIESIGIGTPGITNIEEGVVEYSCNLDFNDTPLSALVEDLMHRPVLLENDANAAALGEYIAGSGKDADSLVAITLGTGVGGGVVINNRLLTGFNFAGGEIGHITIDPEETDACNCGKKGCLEQYASATGIVRMANKLLNASDKPSKLREVQYISAKEIFDAAKTGDELSLSLVEELGKKLGFALASIACVVDPEIFVIGGGVSRAGAILIDTTKKYFQQYAFHACKNTEFELAKLGNDAGMYGGACSVLE